MPPRSIGARSRRRALAEGLQSNRAAENRYVREFRGVLGALHRETLSFLEPRLSKVARADSHNEITNEFDLFLHSILPSLRRHVGPAFDRMIASVLKTNAAAMRKMGISTNELRLGAALDHARDENIRLVENAGRVYAKQVREVFSDPEVGALRVEELKARLLERADVSTSRAELIARDQVLKVNGQITQIRQENAGITEYVWSTSRDERVRESHAALEGETFSWSSPPEPGHPGQDYQCRCVALPVIPGLD
jgi:SPP1 gp7 family putative phage head morphogenesis protein